jgi:hypothetical protein
MIVATGRESRASACTVRVESMMTTAASAIDETPASNQICREVFSVKLRDFLIIPIRLFYQIATSIPLTVSKIANTNPVEKQTDFGAIFDNSFRFCQLHFSP